MGWFIVTRGFIMRRFVRKVIGGNALRPLVVRVSLRFIRQFLTWNFVRNSLLAGRG